MALKNKIRHVVLVVVGGILVSVAACHAGPVDDGPRRESKGYGSDFPRMSVTDRELLPIEEYLISPEEWDLIERARATLIEDCMGRLGFDFVPVGRGAGSIANQTENRYEPTSVRVASARGYHPEVDSPGGNMPGGADDALTDEMLSVLVNESTSDSRGPNGNRVPAGGCAGEADRRLTHGGGISIDAELVVDINFRNYTRAINDARLKEVFAEWSKCMEVRGHSYGTPLEAANDPAWQTSSASTRELEVAVADVKCKEEQNVVGAWFAIESEYERKDIENNRQYLEGVRRSIDRSVRNAADIA